MENPSTNEFMTETSDTTLSPLATQPSKKPMAGSTFQIIVTLLLSALIFLPLGFVFGLRSSSTLMNTSTNNIQSEAIAPSAETPIASDYIQPSENIAAPTESPITSPSTQLGCTQIKDLIGYTYCKYPEAEMRDSITGPSSIKIENVADYSVSPTKQFLFIARYSREYAVRGGGPTEGALTMVDVTNGAATELFSKIYFPSYTNESWSPDGKGIVFTAGGGSKPDIIGNIPMYAVIYCTLECRVLAKDAGPEGIGGDPAFFVNGKVHYTNLNDKAIEIDIDMS